MLLTYIWKQAHIELVPIKHKWSSQKLLEIEKEIVREVARAWGGSCVRWLEVINLTWENLQIAKHKSVRWTERTSSWFVLCDLSIFSGKVYHPEPPHAQSLFLFPILFGINLIHFFNGKNKIGLGRIWSFVLGFRSLVVRLVPFERRAREQRGWKNFGNGKCELIANFSATIVTSRSCEGRDGKCEGRNEKCEFLARESVSSSPIVRIFGKGKCKFIANFSATMVTSLPSLSLYLSLSLSLSPKVPHAQYRKRFRASYNLTLGNVKMAVPTKSTLSVD